MGMIIGDEVIVEESSERASVEAIRAALVKMYRYFFPARVALMTDAEREVNRQWETRVMIVCGNCAGFGRTPRKTLMSVDGRCANCGGASFVNAAQFARVKR